MSIPREATVAITFRPVVDVRQRSTYSFGTESPLWWGMIGIVAIETAVFAILIASYFYLKALGGAWPQGSYGDPELLLPTINTVILLASSVVMHWADKGAKVGDNRRLTLGLIGAFALGLAFLVLKAVEYAHVPYRWDTNAYGSMVWTIIGFHSTHVVVLLLKTAVVSVLAARGYFTPERRLGVIINGLYWHFVVAVWIPLYVVLYWSPRFS